jgi:single-strand DNA-binding protein
MICVVGRLQNKSWEDKHGQKRTATELVADRAYFPGDKLRNTDAPSPFNADAPSPFGDDDDDLPFA